jgi:hypothetical protein
VAEAGDGVSAQKITQSSAKLERWREIRELDRRAMRLIRQGVGVGIAYSEAIMSCSARSQKKEQDGSSSS